MTTPNPYDAALNATAETPPIYGEILFDVWFGVLEKGVGKTPYDPQQHSPAQRRTVVKVDVVPLVETGLTFAIEREFIAEFPRDGWLQITLPSLHALNVTDLQAINGAFVKVETAKYGSYVNKDGEERDRTAPKLLAIYDSREACLEAYYAETGAEPVDTSVPGFDDINKNLGLPVGGSEGVSPSNGNDGSGPKKTALAFLPAIVRSCRQPDNSIDLEALADKLATTPLLKDHFTATSPEVLEEVEKALSDPAF